MKILRKTLFLLTLVTILFRTFSSPISAQDSDFEVNTKYSIIYDNTDYVTIVEEVEFRCNNNSYYYPAQAKRLVNLPDFSLTSGDEEREFKIAALSIKDENGKTVSFDHEYYDNGINITFKEKSDVTKWNTETYTITYKTHELVDKNGNVTNLYVPGLPKDTKYIDNDEKLNLSTKYSFVTLVSIPKDLPQESFMYPIGAFKKSETDKRRVYEIGSDDRIGETSWIQLGTSQYYYFKLIQKTVKTDSLVPVEVNKYTDLASTNVYEIPLPKENEETNQKVLITKMTPEPSDINLDEEGNYIATFQVPSNLESEIIIEGYITLETNSDEKSITNYPLDEYFEKISEDEFLEQYLVDGKYWQITDSKVTEVAHELLKDQQTINDLIHNVYKYIVDTFEYSYEKVEGENARLGAVAALDGSQAVCMEYSDAMIAILRSQGVPARVAIGYGNDPTGAENKIGVDTAEAQRIGHQWLEVWIPEYGWLSVDPTWGESGRTYIGSNLDHILWYTIASDKQNFLGTTIQSANPISQKSFESYEVYLQALPKDQFDKIVTFERLEDIILEYEDVKVDTVSLFLKTTAIGKILVISTPLIVLLVIIFVLSSIFSAIKKVIKIKKQDAKRQGTEDILSPNETQQSFDNQQIPQMNDESEINNNVYTQEQNQIEVQNDELSNQMQNQYQSEFQHNQINSQTQNQLDNQNFNQPFSQTSLTSDQTYNQQQTQPNDTTTYGEYINESTNSQTEDKLPGED